MNAMRIPSSIGVLCLTISALLLGCKRSAPTSDEVRAAVLSAGVVGQPPTEVERRLRELELPGGGKLAVDPFDERRLEIGASARDAQGRPQGDWNVTVLVQFDSSRKATGVQAYKSAMNPL